MIELTSRTSTITRQYLERFGKVRVAIYHLVISQQEPFSSFINSLMITLSRRDQMPCFTWFATAAQDSRYLILWSNGYFRNDLSDITPILFKLGELHGLRNLCEIDCLIGDYSMADCIDTRLNNLISWNYSPINQSHQRSYATSALW